jgi:hypothetical protein
MNRPLQLEFVSQAPFFSRWNIFDRGISHVRTLDQRHASDRHDAQPNSAELHDCAQLNSARCKAYGSQGKL